MLVSFRRPSAPATPVAPPRRWRQGAWLAALPLLLALGTRAQTTLQTESFETDGEGSRYTSNSFLPGTADGSIVGTKTNNRYFLRATETSSTQTISSANWPLIPVSGGALAGSYFWAGEGLRGPDDTRYDRPPGFVQLSAVSVAGYRSLQVKGAFLDARTNGFNWENSDTIKVQVRFSASSPWVTVGQFVGDDSDGAGGGFMRQDSNLNGITSDAADASSPTWNTSMADYTFNVPATGSTLQTRVLASQNGLSEEFGFDNIRVLGTAYATSAPVLAGIESSTQGYPTANAQVALTNTLTVSDADNATLSSALVRFAETKDATNDVLSFAGTAATGNITGTFDASTRTLALTSAGATATLAQWQAALRLVKFQTSTGFPTAGRDRAVLFVVTDPSGNASNAAFRRVGYSTAPTITLAPASLSAGTVGTAYSQALTATGGSSPYTYAVTTGTLPTGLTLSSAGALTGTPTAAGSYSFTVTATDASTGTGPYTGSQAYTLAVSAALATVTTAAPASITSTSATLGGNVSSDGGSAITERGVVYVAGSGTPTTANTKRTATGTTGPYTLSATGLTAGTQYTVRAYAINSAGTSYGSSQTFTTAATLAASTSRTNVSCFGGSNGTATVTATGGVAPYTYSWNTTPAQATATAIGLPAGTYTVTVTDAASQTATAQATITAPSALASSVSSQTNAACFGGSTGAATVAVGGGTPGYTYSWNTTPVQTTATATGLAAGTYTLTITDVNSCTKTQSVTITQPATALSVSVSKTDATANGGTDGTATASPSGGTSPYTYSWNTTPARTTATITGLSAGTYTVTVTDANSCTATATATVGQPAATTATPVVTAPANGSLTNSRTPTYTGTAPAGSTVTVYVDGTSIGTTTATGGSFSRSQPANLADGPHTVAATAQLSGQFVSASSNTNTFTVDATAPTVSLGSTAGASGGSTGTTPIPYTATFSEAVTNFSASGVTVANGTMSGFSGSGTTYMFSVTPAASGTVTVSVAANAAQDAAGNGNTAATPYTLTYAPAPAPLTISGGSLTSPIIIPAGTYTTITVGAAGVAQLGGSVVVNTGLTVNGTLLTACQSLTGPGSFTLAAGATLFVCDDAGISATGNTGAVRTTGPRTFASDASYVYDGGAGVQSTGSGLPATVRNLTAANENANVALSQPVSVRQVLTIINKGGLDLNGQALTLLSDATGTALVVNQGSGTVTGGTATVQRYLDPSLNPGLGYRHYASPVSGNRLSSLATTGFAPVFNPAYNASATPGAVPSFPTVFGYDQARLISSPATALDAFSKGWFSPAATDTFDPAVGYTVNLAGSAKVALTGVPNTGDYTRALARNAGATATDAGWHLVGNPYPAPLDWSLVLLADRSGLDASMYVFESSSQYGGSYRSYANGVGGNSLIASSQGFFVRVSSGLTTSSLTFRNSQRKTSFADQVVMRRGAADTRPLVQLTLAGRGAADDLYVYAEAGATAGLDSQFDAVKMANPSGLNLSAAAPSGEALAIDGRPAFTAATVIPLNVAVPAAGSYTFTAAALANLAGTRAELVDNLTGTRTVLVVGASYRFAMTTTTAPGRFWLNLTPAAGPLANAPAALAAQVLTYPNPTTGRLTVVRPAGATATAVLLNALGQTVRALALPTAETALDLRGLATGVYTLRLTLDGQPVSKRVVVE